MKEASLSRYVYKQHQATHDIDVLCNATSTSTLSLSPGHGKHGRWKMESMHQRKTPHACMRSHKRKKKGEHTFINAHNDTQTRDPMHTVHAYKHSKHHHNINMHSSVHTPATHIHTQHQQHTFIPNSACQECYTCPQAPTATHSPSRKVDRQVHHVRNLPGNTHLPKGPSLTLKQGYPSQMSPPDS